MGKKKASKTKALLKKKSQGKNPTTAAAAAAAASSASSSSSSSTAAAASSASGGVTAMMSNPMHNSRTNDAPVSKYSSPTRHVLPFLLREHTASALLGAFLSASAVLPLLRFLGGDGVADDAYLGCAAGLLACLFARELLVLTGVVASTFESDRLRVKLAQARQHIAHANWLLSQLAMGVVTTLDTRLERFRSKLLGDMVSSASAFSLGAGAEEALGVAAASSSGGGGGGGGSQNGGAASSRAAANAAAVAAATAAATEGIIANMQAQNDSLLERARRLETEKADLEIQARLAAQEAEHARATSARVEQKHADAQGTRTAKLQELTDKLAESEREAQGLRVDNATLRSRVQHLEEAQAEQARVLQARLEEQKSNAEAAAAQAEAAEAASRSARSSEEELAALRSERDSLKTALGASESVLKSATDTITAAHDQALGEKDAQRDRLTEELRQARERLEAAQTEARAAQTEVDTTARRVEEGALREATLQETVASQTVELDALRARVADGERARDLREREHAETTAQTARDMALLREESAQATAALRTEMEARQAAAEEQRVEGDNQLGEVRGQVAILEKQADDLRAALAAAQTEAERQLEAERAAAAAATKTQVDQVRLESQQVVAKAAAEAEAAQKSADEARQRVAEAKRRQEQAERESKAAVMAATAANAAPLPQATADEVDPDKEEPLPGQTGHISSAANPELKNVLKRQRRKSMKPDKEEAERRRLEAERQQKAWEQGAVAGLRDAMKKCKVTELFQHAVSQQEGGDGAGAGAVAASGTVLDMSDVLGMELLVGRALPLLDELEKMIDTADNVAPVSEDGSKPGFQHVTEGNQVREDALAVHQTLQAAVEEVQARSSSEEAKAEALAAAAARGMPDCLQWTAQNRKLVKELRQTECPADLRYTVDELVQLEAANLKPQWLFVTAAQLRRAKGEEGGAGASSSSNSRRNRRGKKAAPRPPEEQCYVPAKVIGKEEEAGVTTLKVVAVEMSSAGGTSSTEVTLRGTSNLAETRDLVDPSVLAAVPDNLADSGSLNEATLLHHLHARFNRERYYTQLGSVMISVNPFQWSERGLYGKKVIQFYVDNRLRSVRQRHVPPHTFALAERAFLALAKRVGGRPQSIIISGESGAGKTEVAKQCLAYLAAVSMAQTTEAEPAEQKTLSRKQSGFAYGAAAEAAAATPAVKQSRFSRSKEKRALRSTRSLLMMGYAPGVSSSLVDKIVSANPILEAFGNAKTLRNNNSSRFGKWLLVYYSKAHSIMGCRNKSYLLEKSRVVFQSPGERNFHIFYLLLLGAPPSVRASIDLGEDGGTVSSPEDAVASFRYVNQSGTCTIGRDHDETATYEELVAALVQLGFEEGVVHDVFRCVAGVLHLGNVDFAATEQSQSAGKEGSRVSDSSRQWLQSASALFGVSHKDLSLWLTKRMMQTVRKNASEVIMELEPNAARAARDATSKAIYDRLFKWIVDRINDSAGPPDVKKAANYIGLLDIFGFEVFEKNGFDQLCIN